jgi:hypothetical protein
LISTPARLRLRLKQYLPRSHHQPPFRDFPDHHKRDNSSKITTIKALPLSTKVASTINNPTLPNKLTNKPDTTMEEIKGQTTAKAFKTTQVASTITKITIRDTKAITKTTLRSMPPSSSSSSNHFKASKIFKLNHFTQQQQVNLGHKLEICLRYQSLLKPPLL